MKACFLAMLALVMVSSSLAQLPYAQEQVIEYAKSIDVQTLDPSLPSQRLEDWLESGPPHAHIWSWRVADTCDLKGDDTNVDYPLCAKVTFSRNGEKGQFLLQLGTLRRGIVGRPQLYSGVGVWEGFLVITGSSERLSDLPALLDQPAVTGGVEKLYEEIVAHHPIGIPTSAEIAAIRPFLSSRLAEQLQTAQACQDDYIRQHPTPGGNSKPGWLKSGLFSGEGSHASPIYAGVTRKEKQNDGSFLVYVDLEPVEARINLGHGHTAFHGGYAWQVEARVISEDGQFVVNDVRIFERFPAQGPSHLLSDSFIGCDGSHWKRVGGPPFAPSAKTKPALSATGRAPSFFLSELFRCTSSRTVPKCAKNHGHWCSIRTFQRRTPCKTEGRCDFMESVESDPVCHKPRFERLQIKRTRSQRV
jgi:hypothetical protein